MPIKECHICTNLNYLQKKKKQYVGETDQTLNQRCRNNDNIVSKHYNGYTHTSDDYLIYAVDTKTDYNKRLQLEEAQVVLLRTQYTVKA